MTLRSGFLILTVAALSACGGGGDRSSTPPPVQTTPPVVQNGTNLAPLAVNDFASVSGAGNSATINVLSNDSDADGDSLSILFTGRPSHGVVTVDDNATASFSSDDRLIYTASSGFVGTDVFSYTITDGRNGRANGYVTLTVGAGGPTSTATSNQKPIANSDSASTQSPDPVAIDVLANDTDGDSQELSLFGFSAAQNGSVSLDDNGTPTVTSDDRLVYVPNSGFEGSDVVTYSVTDGVDVSTGSLTVQVSVADQPPVVAGQVCGIVTLGPVNGAEVSLYSIDALGQPLGAALAQTRTDPNGRWCVVLPQNRADLLVESRGGIFPDPSDSRYERGAARLIRIADQFTLQTILPQDTAFSALTVFSNAVLRKSRVELEGDNFVEVFAGNRAQAATAFGLDVFTADVTDPVNAVDNATTEAQSYAMAVGAAATSLNQIAVDLDVAAPNYILIDALIKDLSECRLNGRDQDGPVNVLVNGQTQAISDNIDLNLQILRFRNNLTTTYAGVPLLQVDQPECEQVVVRPDTLPPEFVTLPNNLRIAAPAGSTVAASNELVQSFLNSVTARDDRDGDVVAFATQLDGSPLPGTFSVGSTPVQFTASDSSGNSAEPVIRFVVVEVNGPPQTFPDRAQTNEDTAIEVDILANDLAQDTPLDRASVRLEVVPAFGSVTLDTATGRATYVPLTDRSGVDYFSYTVADRNGIRSEAVTVLVDVIAQNDAPITVDDSVATLGSQSRVIDVLLNDSDVEGGLNFGSLQLVSLPANGLAVVDFVTGTIAYSPSPGFTGVDVFTYQVADAEGVVSRATPVTVSVFEPGTVLNFAPVASNDLVSAVEDTAITIAVLVNDTDAEGALDSESVSILRQPANGAVVAAPARGELLYTPVANFFGTDQFTYQVADDEGQVSGPATVFISVAPRNDQPVAQNDIAQSTEDSVVQIAVLDNDVDADGLAGAVVVITQQPQFGMAQWNPETARLVYTPANGFDGSDTFAYQVEDADGLRSLPANVTVNLTGLNDAPQVNPDSFTVPGDQRSLLNVLANDTDIDSPLVASNISVVVNALSGSVVYDAVSDQLAYSPNAGFAGSDTFSYSISDPEGATSNTVVVTVTVESLNTAPIAVDDTATAPEQIAVTVAVVDNDTDSDGNLDSSTVLILTAPASGSATVGVDGQITYTSDDEFSGVDRLTYSVADSQGLRSGSATLTITVSAVNEPPVTNGDSGTTLEDTSVTLDVLANDVDPEANINSSSVVVTTAALNGTTTVTGVEGRVTYTPNPNYVGSDSFQYSVADEAGLVSNISTVSVVITSVNDAPVASEDVVATAEDEAVTISVLVNDSDIDGTLDRTSVVLESSPTQGVATVDVANGTVVYTPADDFVGQISFSYRVLDNEGLSSNVTNVTVNVSSVNDAPVAFDDMVTTAEDTFITVSVLENDVDVDGTIEPSSVVLESLPVEGVATVDGSNGTVLYTPTDDFSGQVTFSYRVFDDEGLSSNVAGITVNVTPVNDAPEALDDNVSTDEDTAVDIIVLGNDSDSDGTLVDSTVAIVSAPIRGVAVVDVSGTIRYTPDANVFGLDTFSYRISDNDGEASNDASVTVTINAVNDAAIANDDMATTDENVPVTINVAQNDSDVDGELDVSVVQIVDLPTFGSVAQGASIGELVYTPDFNANGTDQFSYQLEDAAGQLSNLATVSVTVTPQPSNPVVIDSNTTVSNNASVDIFVLLGATDPENDIVDASVSVVVDAAQGTSLVLPDGQVRYVPTAGFVGSDQFTFTVEDGAGLLSNVGTISIDVTAANNAPIASDIGAIVMFSGDAESIDFTASVTDSDGTVDFSTLTVTNETVGSVAVQGSTGAAIYTPPADFAGEASFEYSVVDDDGALSNVAQVSITVWPSEDQDFDGVGQELEVQIGTDPNSADSVYVHIDPDTLALAPDGSSWAMAYPTLEAAETDGKIQSAPGNIVYILMATNDDVTTLGSNWQLAKTANCDNLIFVGSLDPFVATPRRFEGGSPRTKLETVAVGNRPVELANCSNVQFHYLQILGGNGVARGGGLSIANSTVVLNSVYVRDNVATQLGGGIYVTDIAGTPSQLTIENSTLRDNSIEPGSDTDSSGGGIYISNAGNLTITDSLVRHNSAPANGTVAASSLTGGGGLYVENTPLYLSNTAFSANRTAQCGGGLHLTGTQSTRVEHGNFSGNEAQNFGGGICLRDIDTNTTVHNNLITSNFADTGGGIFLIDTDKSRVTNNTFVFNLADTSGGGVHFDTSADPVLSYNIAQFNTSNGAGNDIGGDNGQLIALDASYNFITSFFANFVGTGNSSAPIEFDQGYYQRQTSPGVDYGVTDSDDPLFALNLRYTDASGVTTDQGLLDAGFHYFYPEIRASNGIQVLAPDGLNSNTDNQRLWVGPLVDGVLLGRGHRLYVDPTDDDIDAHLYTFTDDVLDPLGTGDSTQLRDLGNGYYEVLLDIPPDVMSFELDLYIDSITTPSAVIEIGQ